MGTPSLSEDGLEHSSPNANVYQCVVLPALPQQTSDQGLSRSKLQYWRMLGLLPNTFHTAEFVMQVRLSTAACRYVRVP